MAETTHQHLRKFQEANKDKGRLLICCPDQPGIVAAVSNFLFQNGANIMESSQYTTDAYEGTFFLRIEFDCPGLLGKEEEMKSKFQAVAENFNMQWDMKFVYQLKRTAIFVSKQLHCLRELLWEWQSGDLVTDIAVVVSNHEDARDLVESVGIPFHYIPANKDIRQEAEAKQLELLEDYKIDQIVLARYMQILTPDFVAAYPSQIINIHHSFLPAFIGANPYGRAYERGVKLIGATSHYVTNDLDEGPIIEQDIMRVDHRDNAEDLKKIGRKVERSVLARGVKWDLEDRILVHQNKTIVFN
ncbi:formyltetrahydrofolate deformylase [Thalassobacillus devorans]|uniref:Formyltetrahydrofolate deformylase n=1 Tax=Thalassobacillus devorans TaxID=279813 RepID=A0ABQ1PKF1_9BACI|nr:formyltetrahydrofolate deformylase [Thalassobacillus devorans]NIK30143.1 formyltetrahydrofolate deformylase [Thalassobacillus devorans]GGC98694.1 formyltetrahydrofolate deformylase [Thalassobacillus devorans]